MADQPLAEKETIIKVTRTLTYSVDYKENTPEDVLNATTEYGTLQAIVEVGSGSPKVVSLTTDKVEKVTQDVPELPDFANMTDEEAVAYVAKAFGITVGGLDAMGGLSLS